MQISPIFEKFMKKAPMGMMGRSLIERMLNPEQLDEWFDSLAENQYERDLLFSSTFNIMSQVVCGAQPSVHAAFQSMENEVGVSITSVYNKLKGIEIITSRGLVRHSSSEAENLIKELGGGLENPLPGYHIKLLDGNCIEASDKRISELRTLTSGVLPGKSLVVLDPVTRIILDVFPCEDGHAQERSLFQDVLITIAKRDVWIADRNFCTLGFLLGIIDKNGFFIIRQHGNLPYEPVESKMRYIGKTETGKVYEQLVKIVDDQGKSHTVRRICVKLNGETRDGDKQIYILTNLPSEEVSAIKIAKLYRGRWKIETAFQELTTHLNSEINSLGYPKAALFAFCVALVTYNMFAVMKAVIQNVHGIEVIENQISGYYIANEISNSHMGIAIAIPDEEWKPLRTMENLRVAEFLVKLAGMMKLRKYKKHPRGPKKKTEKTYDKKTPHVSIAKILSERKT